MDKIIQINDIWCQLHVKASLTPSIKYDRIRKYRLFQIWHKRACYSKLFNKIVGKLKTKVDRFKTISLKFVGCMSTQLHLEVT